jgi:energy-coupling factor transporter ATP-binding protein EcfA2
MQIEEQNAGSGLSILQEIVEWSETRPLWQRDALRRIVTQGELSKEDYDQLITICKQQRGIETPSVSIITPIPLSGNDIPRQNDSATTVKLKSLHNLIGVNALVSDSKLSFGSSGITIIYGDNATGKSGYVRLLKQLCRTRGARDQILPNIFDINAIRFAEAEIDYQLNDTESNLHWMTNSASPEYFREVSIFDEFSAGVYVDENCEVAYLPFGLDLLPRLADVCNEISNALRTQATQLSSLQFIPTGIPLGTQAANIINRIDQRNIKDEVIQFTNFSKEDQQRLNEINLTLSRLKAESPTSRAIEIKTRANRFQILRETFEKYLNLLSNEQIDELREAITLQKSRESAFTVLQNQSFSDELLPGIGTETWRNLWNGAKQYSELHLHKDFPPSNIGELCVLCHQPLRHEEIERFQRFNNFLNATIQAEVDRARQTTKQLRQAFQNLSAEPFLTSDTFEELSSIKKDEAIFLQKAQEVLLSRRQEALSTEIPESLDKITPLPKLEFSWLVEVENKLIREATALSSAVNPSEQDQLLNKQNELIGRQKLTEIKTQILNEIDRRVLLSSIKDCLQDTDTTRITRFNTELTHNALIKVLSRKFSEHLSELRVQHTSASISRGPGEHGVAYHKIEIKAQQHVKASNILSRGEHRAIAIAAFLAELETQQSESTIILDDPVSSLDQDRRKYVAKSLVLLSKKRPIIIFTHDLFFLFLLREEAKPLGIEIVPRFLRRDREKVGVVTEGFPWVGQNTSERIGTLKLKSQQVAALYRKGQTDEYEKNAKEIYGLLRETWERAVEEVLFNNSITRFTLEIKTNSLRNLWGLDQTIITRLENGMAKSSRWLTGHDSPILGVETIPDAHELESDILELENWVKEVRKHHRR